MLTLFYGTDTIKVRQAAFATANKLCGADGELELIAAESYQPGRLQDVAGAVSLFGTKIVYVLDTPSGDSVFSAEANELLASLAESNNQFVAIEGPLLAADKKRWQKHTSEMTEAKAVASERFNTFAMADALARKDKKTLWLLLQEAKLAGQSAEEIIGVLWWQLKSLRLAAVTNQAAEAGMKDFPYNKAKRALNAFEAGELELLSRRLLTVYHDGHGGKVDIDLALEQWCLTL